MLKFILILIAVPFLGEPIQTDIEQPSIEVCAKEAGRRLQEASSLAPTVKYLAATCVVFAAPGQNIGQ